MKNTLSKHSPHLLSEIDYEKNKDFDPSKVGFSSTTKIWWKCKNNHSYYASIGSRTRDKGTGCPICGSVGPTMGSWQSCVWPTRYWISISRSLPGGSMGGSPTGSG